MSLSAFGVDHGEVYKAAGSSADREKAYGRTANTMAALGGTTAAIGTGSKIVGHLESKGHDPMGFTMRETHKEKPMVPAHRARVLEINAKMHGQQARYAAGLAAGALTVAGAAKLKQKRAASSQAQRRALSKRDRKASDVALGAGEAGVGGAGIYGGQQIARGFGRAAYAHIDNARVQGHNLKSAKKGLIRMGAKEKEFTRVSRNMSRRVVGVKGAGALAGVGVAGLGAAGVYQGAQHMRKPRS